MRTLSGRSSATSASTVGPAFPARPSSRTPGPVTRSAASARFGCTTGPSDNSLSRIPTGIGATLIRCVIHRICRSEISWRRFAYAGYRWRSRFRGMVCHSRLRRGRACQVVRSPHGLVSAVVGIATSSSGGLNVPGATWRHRSDGRHRPTTKTATTGHAIPTTVRRSAAIARFADRSAWTWRYPDRTAPRHRRPAIRVRWRRSHC